MERSARRANAPGTPIQKANPHATIAAQNAPVTWSVHTTIADRPVTDNQMPDSRRVPRKRADGSPAIALAENASETTNGESPTKSVPIAPM